MELHVSALYKVVSEPPLAVAIRLSCSNPDHKHPFSLQVSASSSSASMDKQASGAQPPQPAEIAHTESASAESALDKASDNDASDAPGSSSFVAPLFQHFPSHFSASDASRGKSTSILDSGLHRDSNASSDSFAGFESARAKAALEMRLSKHRLKPPLQQCMNASLASTVAPS